MSLQHNLPHCKEIVFKCSIVRFGGWCPKIRSFHYWRRCCCARCEKSTQPLLYRIGSKWRTRLWRTMLRNTMLRICKRTNQYLLLGCIWRCWQSIFLHHLAKTIRENKNIFKLWCRAFGVQPFLTNNTFRCSCQWVYSPSKWTPVSLDRNLCCSVVGSFSILFSFLVFTFSSSSSLMFSSCATFVWSASLAPLAWDKYVVLFSSFYL